MQVPLLYQIIDFRQGQLSPSISSFLDRIWLDFFRKCPHETFGTFGAGFLFVGGQLDLPWQKIELRQFIDEGTGIHVIEGNLVGVLGPFDRGLGFAGNGVHRGEVSNHDCWHAGVRLENSSSRLNTNSC